MMYEGGRVIANVQQRICCVSEFVMGISKTKVLGVILIQMVYLNIQRYRTNGKEEKKFTNNMT
ncbi:hypothetical protein SLEP1_g13499 [Rubroshorea leprosula]|uniref:Uncharacterized protein n=1 Tax=Rubroshorea leprosula TaxID=152421 RepID=A0AAV5IP64_9ROSI|nr:hypothetical protein SLEP1_g13499 [Rubroshorea leprosula]